MNYTEQQTEPQTAGPESVPRLLRKDALSTASTSLDQYRELYRSPDHRRVQFHLIWPDRQPSGKQEILVAGCGTSQAARYAIR